MCVSSHSSRVHIRRTDKLNVGEASYHGLEEYMVQVGIYSTTRTYLYHANNH